MRTKHTGQSGVAAVSLLSRVRAPTSAGRATASEVRASILRHLQAMCGTRLGSMPVRPDYGLPAISEMVHSFPDATSAIARALVYTIETYEPRLARVRVRHVPSEGSALVVCFEVTATLRGEDDDTKVRFSTSIDGSRRITVA